MTPHKAKTVFRAILALVIAIALVVAVLAYRQLHYWPFATGSNDFAFLGTTFGMSRQEAERALRRHGAKLMDYHNYKAAQRDPALQPSPFTEFLPSDERDFYELYMPSITMFGADTQAQFEFEKSRLRYVDVSFHDYSQPPTLIPLLVKSLEERYKFTEREDSQHIPGAYTLKFVSGSVTASLWIDLTDPKKQIISLYLSRESDRLRREEERLERDQSAFGAPHKG